MKTVDFAAGGQRERLLGDSCMADSENLNHWEKRTKVFIRGKKGGRGYVQNGETTEWRMWLKCWGKMRI